MEASEKDRPLIYLVENFFHEFNLQPGHVIGHGMSGDVIMATARGHPDQKRAIKTFRARCRSSRAVRQFEREVNFMRSLDHPHIVKCLIAAKTESCMLYLCMQLYECGTLANILKSVTTHEVQRVFVQISSAVDYMHMKRIYHADIKLENIFMATTGDAALGDLGLARQMTEDEKTVPVSSVGGTRAYYPPEIASENSAFTDVDPFKLDSFALGVVLWALVFRSQPRVGIDYSLDVKTYPVPKKFVDCFNCLLHPHPNLRGTLARLMDLLRQMSPELVIPLELRDVEKLLRRAKSKSELPEVER